MNLIRDGCSLVKVTSELCFTELGPASKRKTTEQGSFLIQRTMSFFNNGKAASSLMDFINQILEI